MSYLHLKGDLSNLPGAGCPLSKRLICDQQAITDPTRIKLALQFGRISGHIPGSIFVDNLKDLKTDLEVQCFFKEKKDDKG